MKLSLVFYKEGICSLLKNVSLKKSHNCWLEELRLGLISSRFKVLECLFHYIPFPRLAQMLDGNQNTKMKNLTYYCLWYFLFSTSPVSGVFKSNSSFCSVEHNIILFLCYPVLTLSFQLQQSNRSGGTWLHTCITMVFTSVGFQVK